ncbi:hypothetical protein B0J14DRAFT_83110 [Halenospora varia]|nr:hypothetical protein B0J14DRAFT_83110 [Halenospora varia]
MASESFDLAETGLITNLGPLTTIWTPPASCYQTTTSWRDLWGREYLYLYNNYGLEEFTCWPSVSFNTIPSSIRPGTDLIESLDPITDRVRTQTTSGTSTQTFFPLAAGWEFYSPGICPTGWTPSSSLARFRGHRVAESGISVTLCCPIGYPATFIGEDLGGSQIFNFKCMRNITNSASITNLLSLRLATASMKASYTVLPTASVNASFISVRPIVVMYQTTDLEIMRLLARSTTIPTSALTVPSNINGTFVSSSNSQATRFPDTPGNGHEPPGAFLC